MIFSSVCEEYHARRDAESPRTQNLPFNDSNEKKRRTEVTEEFFCAKHPRSNSEGSFFLTSTGPSPVPGETVNNFSMDYRELDVVDSQRLDANHHMESVFRFMPLDKPLTAENSFLSPRERIDTFSDSKHQCNVSSICDVDFSDNGHVFTPSALSPRHDDKKAHQSNSQSAFSERHPHSAPSSAQSKSAKVIHNADSFESKMVPPERTGTEVPLPRTSPVKSTSGLAVSTAFEDCEDNEFDNCTTIESSSVSCRSRASGMSASRSVARSEVSVDRSWAQNHNASSYRIRHRDGGSDSRGASSRASNSWVSAAPASSSSYKVPSQTHFQSSRVSPYSSVSRRSTSYGGYRSKEQGTHSRAHSRDYTRGPQQQQVSARNSRDRSPQHRRCGSSSSYYGAERPHHSHNLGLSHGRSSRSSSRSSDRPARTEWSRGTYSASSYSYALEYRSSSTGFHEPSAARSRRVARVHGDLPLEWWERSEDCKEAKARHTDRIDHICDSREDLVLKTTLWKEDTVLEPNMFPYSTPYGVEHHTLWSIHELSHPEIVAYVDGWLRRHMPHVRRWQYDDNSGERSINLFHVHIFIETAPYSFTPRDGMLYIPPHAQADVESKDDL